MNRRAVSYVITALVIFVGLVAIGFLCLALTVENPFHLRAVTSSDDFRVVQSSADLTELMASARLAEPATPGLLLANLYPTSATPSFAWDSANGECAIANVAVGRQTVTVNTNNPPARLRWHNVAGAPLEAQFAGLLSYRLPSDLQATPVGRLELHLTETDGQATALAASVNLLQVIPQTGRNVALMSLASSTRFAGPDYAQPRNRQTDVVHTPAVREARLWLRLNGIGADRCADVGPVRWENVPFIGTVRVVE